MTNARRYKPTNSRLFTWILRNTLGLWLQIAYKAKTKGIDLFKKIEAPFILIGNHTTLLDPFLTNSFVPYPIHWVSSDGNMRSPIMRFLLIKLVGSIPKSKVIPDIETVNWIVEFIRKRRAVVGFYPEGQSSWNSSSVPAFGSSAKLLKLLKVPVVCALSRGSYMTKPRWAYTRREGHVEIEYSLLFSPQDLKTMSLQEIDEKLNTAIDHDDCDWALRQGLKYSDPCRAECLELALYACPSCGALHTLHSKHDSISCSSCGFCARYGEDGSFSFTESRIFASSAPPKTVRSWDEWQEAHLAKLLESEYIPNPARPIFMDDEVILLKGKRMDTMKNLGTGTLALNAEGLDFIPRSGASQHFEIGEIEGPNVLKWNFFEFYIGKTVYRARFKDRAASGRKYAVGVSLLLKLKAQATPEP
jgi:1-acyl-sn-glycerol-3-phosphate acyltransferase